MDLDVLFVLKNNAAYLQDRGFPKAAKACTDAVTEIARLRAALQHIAALHPMTDQDTGFVDNSAQETASAALHPSP